MMLAELPDGPQPVQHELHEGDAVVHPFWALVFEFDDRVKQDFDDRGDCLFCEIGPTQFVKAGVIHVIGTDANRPAAVHFIGVCEDCAELYGDGLARALRIWWEDRCRENFPTYGLC